MTAILINYSSKGLISREEISAQLRANNAAGLRFLLNESSDPCIILADADAVSFCQRNTVMAAKSASGTGKSLCLVEHFMAAAALANLKNYDLLLEAEELPFGDGSSIFWWQLMQENALVQPITQHKYRLKEEIRVADDTDPSRYIIAKPANASSISYQLVMPEPIGEQSFTYSPDMDPESLLKARTFSSLAENKMLGLDNWVLGYDENGFDQELHFPDEAARHKCLDLIGDLYLSTFNPLEVDMEVISHKGSHALNNKMAKALKQNIVLN